MPLVSQSINSLIGGVVQTAQAARDASQCSEMINAFVSLALGVGKRPPTNRVAQVDSSPIGYGNAFVHLINRDVGDRWHVVIANNTVKVFDARSGSAQVVNIVGGNADGYLTSSTPFTDFKATTIGDFTFLINKTKTVAKKSTTVAARQPEALVAIRQSDYSTTFTVTVNSTSFSFTTPDGTSASQRSNISTDHIAAQLQGQFNISALAATFACNVWGSTLHIFPQNGTTDFTISATDGLADNGILAIKGSVQRFDDLPLKAVPGFIVQVATDPGNPFTSSWWVYSETGTANQNGVWRETPKPGENYQLDPATMPHVLINNGNGSFTFQQATWSDRVVGELAVNPFPSFVGKTLNEVFFHQNRLGVTAGEHVVLSCAGSLFNFFRTTAQKLIDSDVVDVQAASARVSVHNHAIYWNEGLYLWSDQDQYNVFGNPFIAPTTVALPVISSNPSDRNVKPLVLGKRVFYCWSINGNTKLYEYFIPIYRQTPEATDLTKELPKYIQGNAKALVGNENLGFVALLTDFDPTKLYVYFYHYRDYNSKDLSAWCSWQLPPGSQIVSLNMVDGQITMLVARPDGVYLETMNVGEVATLQSQTSAAFGGSPVSSGPIGQGAPAGTLGDTAWTVSPWSPGLLGADFTSNPNGPFTVSDPFADANSTLLQAHTFGPANALAWQKRGANDAWIQANAVQADTTKQGGQYTAVYDPGSDDQTVTLHGAIWSEKSDFVGCTVRGNLSDRTCYRAIITPVASSTDATVQLFKMDASYSPISLSTVTIHSFNALVAHTFQLSVSGTTLKVLVDGATIINTTDSAIASGHYAGIDLSGGFDAGSVTKIDSVDITASPQPSVPVTISFSKPIYSAVIVVEDPTYNNPPAQAQAFDLAGNLLNTVTFAGNNDPTTNTPQTQTLVGPNISKIVLTPGKSATGTGDWVGYKVTATLGGGIPVFLDRQFRSTDAGVVATFDGGTGQTTWTLPFQTTEPLVVVRYDDASHQGTVIPTTQPDSTHIVTVGASQDWSTSLVLIGASFNFSMTLSTIYLRNRQDGSAETKGRTQLRTMQVKHRETTSYTVTVTPDAGRPARAYTFSSAQPVEGVFAFPVLCENDRCDITITSSGPTGLFLSSLDWEGFYHVRSQRL